MFEGFERSFFGFCLQVLQLAISPQGVKYLGPKGNKRKVSFSKMHGATNGYPLAVAAFVVKNGYPLAVAAFVIMECPEK